MKIELPEPSLVLLVGPSGAGKTTFAGRHFRPTEVLSSDHFRGLVSDDENDQSATEPAFEALHLVADRRLAAGRLTVIDATNVQFEARRPLLAMARRHGLPAIAIVLDVPLRICEERNRARQDRQGLGRVLARQHAALRRSLGGPGGLASEGFGRVWTLGPGELDSVEITRRPAEPGDRASAEPARTR